MFHFVYSFYVPERERERESSVSFDVSFRKLIFMSQREREGWENKRKMRLVTFD